MSVISVLTANGTRAVIPTGSIAAVFEGDSHGVEVSLVNGETVYLAKSVLFEDVIQSILCTVADRSVILAEVRTFLAEGDQ